MFRILRTRSGVDRGGRQMQGVRDTYARVNANTQSMVEWIRGQAFTAPSSHPLMTMLLSISPDVNLDVHEYYDRVTSRVYQTARSFSAATPVFVGEARKSSMLYGEGYRESILASDFKYNVLNIDEQWMEWKPLIIRKHPITETTVPHLLTPNLFGEKGDVVLEIDLVALAMKYWKWHRETWSDDEDVRPSVRRYLTDHVLANAIEDHMNIAIFNRLLGHMRGSELRGFRRIAPILTIDYTPRIDRYLLDRNSMNIDSPDHWEYMIDGMLLPTGDLWDLLRLPPTSFNRQTNWVVNMMRMDVFEWLARLDYHGFRTINRHIKNQLRRSILLADNNGIYRAALGSDGHAEMIEHHCRNILRYL